MWKKNVLKIDSTVHEKNPRRQRDTLDIRLVWSLERPLKWPTRGHIRERNIGVGH
jgi:hypothetical protein